MAASNDVIIIRVYINKQFDATEQFDIAQDVWKLAEIDKESMENVDVSAFNDLREDIPKAFRNSKLFKPLFKNEEEWEWKIYSYQISQASVIIDNDKDLQNEMDSFLPLDEDLGSDDELKNENTFLRLRVVFSRGMIIMF